MRERTGRLAGRAAAAVVIGIAFAGWCAVALAGLAVERALQGKHPRADRREPWAHHPEQEGGS